MKTTLLLASAAVLALTAGTVSAGTVHPSLTAKGTSHYVAFTPRNGSTDLYDQSAYSLHDTEAIVSDNWTSGTEGTKYNSAGANDFELPSGNWTITTVVADGFIYESDEEPTSFDVTFFKGKTKKSGTTLTTIVSCPDLSFTDVNSSGEESIDVSTCTAGMKFKGGKDYYYVSVVANTEPETRDPWYWWTNKGKPYEPALWENPANGYGTDCKTWSTLDPCIKTAGTGPTLSFAIYGIPYMK